MESGSFIAVWRAVVVGYIESQTFSFMENAVEQHKCIQKSEAKSEFTLTIESYTRVPGPCTELYCIVFI